MYREVGTPRVMQPKPNKPPHSPEAEFDLQRFSTYEDQVKSHGGSGNIKPDRIIEARKIPQTAEPLSIIDHIGKSGIVDKRSFYDEEGKLYLDIHVTNHNFPKQHPFGNHGEHAHDVTWENGHPNWSKGKNLTDAERKDNGDIL